MSSPPPHKRHKQTPATASPGTLTKDAPTLQPALAPHANADHLQLPAPPTTPSHPRKRRVSPSPKSTAAVMGNAHNPTTPLPAADAAAANVSIPNLLADDSAKKGRGRTNTPWTPQEEQRLKQMRDTGLSWSDIAKSFPNRTEGSVKKHWYKDMHYAEFGEDESAQLREAIKDYETNKWKIIGAKVGKPAKACEQYAKEHFKSE